LTYPEIKEDLDAKLESIFAQMINNSDIKDLPENITNLMRLTIKELFQGKMYIEEKVQSKEEWLQILF